MILVTQYRLEEEYPISPEIRRVCSEPDESALQGGRIRNFCVRFGALREIWNAYKPDVILSFLGKNNLMAVATIERHSCRQRWQSPCGASRLWSTRDG